MALTELCGSYGLTYEDHLPLTADGTAYQTDRSGEDAMDKRLNQFLQAQKWAETMEPAELFQKLCQRYRIDETLTAETARTIAGIRFDLETGRFSTLEPFVFLKEIPLELAICIGERADDLPGVRAETTYQREYQTIYAAHTLGHLGLINADEYAELADQGYRSNDRVGRDGAEKAFESDLHGRAGYEKLRLTADGLTLCDETDYPGEVALTLMSVEKPAADGSTVQFGTLAAARADGAVRIVTEAVSVTDARLRQAWPDTLYRTRLYFTGQLALTVF